MKVLDGAAIVLQPMLLLLKSMPMLLSLPTSRRICTLASMLMLYGILTLLEVLKNQQGGIEKKEFKGRWKVGTRFQETGPTSKNSLHSSLIKYIHIASTECTEGKQIFATSGSTVIARGTTSHCMEMCDHEEADSSPARYP